MNTSLVSIIVPVFNSERYLNDFIQSMRNQSYTNWELIMVDDGSVDSSVPIIQEYEKKDHRIKLIRRIPERIKGGNTCRNIGFEQAKGKYVIWYDADDVVAPYALKQRVQYMQLNPELDFAVFPALGFQGNVGNWNGIFLGYKSEQKALNNLINRHLPFAVWTNIYKTSSIIEKNITWDENLVSLQDSDFNINCIFRGLKFKVAKGVPADYFWRDASSSVTKKIKSKSHCDNHIYFLNKLYDLFGENKDYSTDLKYVYRWFFNILYENNKERLKELKHIESKRNHSFFLLRNILINTINIKLKNDKFFSCLQFLFFPINNLKVKLNAKSIPLINPRKRYFLELSKITINKLFYRINIEDQS